MRNVGTAMRLLCVRMLIVVAALMGVAHAQLMPDGTYRLQPEDILRILVYNDQQLSSEVAVGFDGNITAPFLGVVRAEGLTTSELEKVLAEEYTKQLRLRDPRVSVQLLRFRAIRALVGGAVSRPGLFEMRPTDNILTLFTLAGGGSNSGVPDIRRATLRRKNSVELIPIDLYAMINRGDMSQNYTVRDGDELIVPEDFTQRIIVSGTINRPGVFPWREQMTVMDAVGQAGGPIPNRTILSKVTIFRPKPGSPGEFLQIKCDLVRFQDHADASQNVILKPGDYIFIPNNKAPDLNQISGVLNSLWFFNVILRDNVLGVRLGR